MSEILVAVPPATVGEKIPMGVVFKNLNSVDITPYIKEKMKIKYLPWSSAWTLLMTYYPDFTYTALNGPALVEGGSPIPYFTDGKTCWVETSLTIGGNTINEKLTIMDSRNNAIPLENVTIRDALDSQQRCFVKNAARFGLGLSLWIGDDYSENGRIAKKERDEAAAEQENALTEAHKKIIDLCNEKITAGVDKDKLYEIIKTVGKISKPNPNSIKDVDLCGAVYDAIKAVEPAGKESK